MPANTIANVTVLPPTGLTIGAAKVAVTSTAMQLTASPTSMLNGAIVQALAGNSGLVYVGFSNVTDLGGAHPGYELQAGQAMPVGIVDLSLIYVVGVTVGDGVCFIGS